MEHPDERQNEIVKRLFSVPADKVSNWLQEKDETHYVADVAPSVIATGTEWAKRIIDNRKTFHTLDALNRIYSTVAYKYHHSPKEFVSESEPDSDLRIEHMQDALGWTVSTLQNANEVRRHSEDFVGRAWDILAHAYLANDKRIVEFAKEKLDVDLPREMIIKSLFAPGADTTPAIQELYFADSKTPVEKIVKLQTAIEVEKAENSRIMGETLSMGSLYRLLQKFTQTDESSQK